MNIIQDGSHRIVFSTGKEIQQPFTIFSLSVSGIAYCANKDVHEITIEGLTDIEKTELAELMIERWKNFGGIE